MLYAVFNGILFIIETKEAFLSILPILYYIILIVYYIFYTYTLNIYFFQFC